MKFCSNLVNGNGQNQTLGWSQAVIPLKTVSFCTIIDHNSRIKVWNKQLNILLSVFKTLNKIYTHQPVIKRGNTLDQVTYRSSLTASAIIASITTSAIADPRFCTVKRIMSGTLALRKDSLTLKISHGKRESNDAIFK